MDKQLLTIATSKVQKTWNLTDQQAERASVLVEAVKPFASQERFPDSFHVKSSSRSIIYVINLGTLTCQCEDWKKHNQEGQETKHICKHIISAFIYRQYHVEVEKQAQSQPWQTQFDVWVNRAGLTPQTTTH